MRTLHRKAEIMKRTLDWNQYLEAAAAAVSEGIVMLKNEHAVLPLHPDEEVAVFGRIQAHYYKSGTGSGGLVNAPKVVGIPEGLRDAGIRLNPMLLETYRTWEESHPFDIGTGWGKEPWSQEEMPLDDALVAKAAETSGTAIVILGRTAGEEQDNRLEKGAFLLSDAEADMLRKVRAGFSRMVVLLNVGGLIDMEVIEEIAPDAILYVWQGGMTGGTGTAAVLTGRVSPSGKLPDTIAYRVEDYPSHANFGSGDEDIYAEDIYVGYRYFETFAKDRVRYPFGFGLSYTAFDVETAHACEENGTIRLVVRVRNTGRFAGKEVVQVYCEAPQGALGKPSRVLCAYAKTQTLAPGAEEILHLAFPLSAAASYDDSGVSGHRFSEVLEAGEYHIFAGTDVRSAQPVLTVSLPETQVVRALRQALAPVQAFRRLRPVTDGECLVPSEEDAPLLRFDEAQRRLDHLPEEIAYTGDCGIKLSDVLSGKNTLDEFIAQLDDASLCCLVRGEGMGSPRVTAGTASAFGAVADHLEDYGIPCACCSDGPSGMRLDCGTKAFSLPNGTLLASTFNTALIRELYVFMGLEMTANRVECLLGPGMNIHRHPLNGRNFEYFSEDPYLTGTMATAQLRGLQEVGVTGTIKHFCGNNRETRRHYLDSVVSERALREIYLKGFEIAVRSGAADSIMTTYGRVNGLWTAGSFDLNTEILREEWGFSGIVMTDWWANINVSRSEGADKRRLSAMVRAQNDLYMVCAEGGDHDDDLMESLADGSLTRGELQRCARNTLRFLLRTNAMKRLCGEDCDVEILGRPDLSEESDAPVVFYEVDEDFTLDLRDIAAVKGRSHSFALILKHPGFYEVTMTASSTQSELAQLPVTLFTMGTARGIFTWNGTAGEPVEKTTTIPMFSRYTALRMYFGQNGLELHSIRFTREEKELPPEF